MPVKRRRAFTKLLQQAYEEQEKLMKKANKGESTSNSRQITPQDSQMIRKMFQNKQL